MDQVLISGIGMTPFRKHKTATSRQLAEIAAFQAMTDAGLQPKDIDLVVAANASEGILHGQEMIRGQVALRNSGLLGVPFVNVENACASSSTALFIADMAIRSGRAQAVLVVGFEKLTHSTKDRSLAAIGSAMDLYEMGEVRRRVQHTLLGSDGDANHGVSGAATRPAQDSGSEGAAALKDVSPFMAIYATKAKKYMTRSGATVYDFARVAAKNHRNGFENPLAQYGSRTSADAILSGRTIVNPLTLLMCAPISDGAAAVVVSNADIAKRASGPRVRISGIGIVSGTNGDNDSGPVQRAARAAYEDAGVAPKDISVAEVHDAVAPAELELCEDLGFCSPGDGPRLVREGATRIGGSIPVNPSGGLIARGHPIGATGCAQVVELTQQLRQRCGSRQVPSASLALAQNSGGELGGGPAATIVLILERLDRA